jgi:hypothetical protein
MRLMTLCLVTLLSASAMALDVHFDLTGQDGKKISATLSGYDYEQAIVSAKANFCDTSMSVVSWSDDTTTSLTVDGVQYLIDADTSFEVRDPNVGTVNKFYYSSYTFKDQATCEQVFAAAQKCQDSSQGGLIHESDLNAMKLSFVIRPANVGTTMAQVQLKLNFDKHEVQLLTLKSPAQSGGIFNSANWEITGTGKF